MLRLIALLALVWLASVVARIVIRAMGRPRTNFNGRAGMRGTETAQPPPIDLRDVRDAEFKDITEKEQNTR